MKNSTVVSILIGIPMYEPTLEFQLSLSSFLSEIESKGGHYRVDVMEVKDKPLVDAQNQIADYFISHDKYDYLLILEDDHSGHKVAMLRALLKANAPVCGINYFSRHFPYYSCLMEDRYPETPMTRFVAKDIDKGYAECDLVGFAMALFKREVFEKLDKPFFRLNKFAPDNSYATDIDFSDRCRASGIKLIGCFDYVLCHRDINKENRFEKMKEELPEYIRKGKEENINRLLNSTNSNPSGRK